MNIASEWFSNLSEHQNHLEACQNTAGQILRVPDLVDLGWDPRIYISPKFPGEAELAGLGTTLWEMLVPAIARCLYSGLTCIYYLYAFSTCLLFLELAFFIPWASLHPASRLRMGINPPRGLLQSLVPKSMYPSTWCKSSPNLTTLHCITPTHSNCVFPDHKSSRACLTHVCVIAGSSKMFLLNSTKAYATSENEVRPDHFPPLCSPRLWAHSQASLHFFLLPNLILNNSSFFSLLSLMFNFSSLCSNLNCSVYLVGFNIL